MAKYRGRGAGADFAALRFDPEESLVAAVDILQEAGVPFAVAGRLAVWSYVPLEGQQLTKDVDLAIPHGRTRDVIVVAEARGFRVRALNIGGCGVRRGGVAIDFIDRHPHLSQLFSDAVRAARRQRRRMRAGGKALPIVPRDYLIAMKLVVMEPKDERDVIELLKVTPRSQYRRLRSLVQKYHGYLGAQRLDHLAKAAGHSGPADIVERYR